MNEKKTVIAFPEWENENIQEAVKQCIDIIEPYFVDKLNAAFLAVKSGEADAVIAGVDYSTRDVILAARDNLGLKMDYKTFSSLIVMELPDGRELFISDAAVTKNPTKEQLFDIASQSIETVSELNIEPKVAFLSFSTNRSGGKDESVDKIEAVLPKIREKYPDIAVDGELQLDTAVNPIVAAKKAPKSSLKGEANVLIVPNLNAGNILYKSIQQFGGAKAYGPILQGFNGVVSDLSRGATVEDIVGTIKNVCKITHKL